MGFHFLFFTRVPEGYIQLSFPAEDIMKDNCRTILMSKEKTKTVAVGLVTAAIVFFILCLSQRELRGPFIFGDETTYFNLARIIDATGTYGGATQYNPLYPFIISLFFDENDIGSTYKFSLVLNCLYFSFGALFLHLLASRFFTRFHSFVFALFASLMPWTITTWLIWAEPLYYSLFLACVYTFILLVESNRKSTALILGILVGLLFLAKQAGVLTFGAALIAYLLVRRRTKVEDSGPWLTPIIYLCSGFSLLVFPWLIRNLLTPGAGLLGYKERVTDFLHVAEYLGRFGEALAYQSSYLIAATYLIFPAVFLAICCRRKNLSANLLAMFYFTVILTMELLILTSLHRSTLPGAENIPFGRYLAPIVPLLIMLGIVFIREAEISLRFIIVSCLLMAFFVGIYSPLGSTTAYGVINNFDLIYLNDFWFNGGIDWGTHRAIGSRSDPYLYSAALLCIAVVLFVLIKKKKSLGIIAIGLLIGGSGFIAHQYIPVLAATTSGANEIFLWLREKKIPYENVAIDEKIHSYQVKQISSFWSGRAPTAMKAITFGGEYGFDFGTISSPASGNLFRIGVPFHPSGAYSVKKGYGFEDLFNIDSRHNNTSFGNGADDFIFGWKEHSFRIDADPGQYNLFVTIYIGEKFQFDVDYDLKINGIKQANIMPKKNTLVEERVVININEGPIQLTFNPAKSSVWLVNSVRLKPIQDDLSWEGEFFVTKKELPFAVAKQVNHLIVYQRSRNHLYRTIP